MDMKNKLNKKFFCFLSNAELHNKRIKVKRCHIRKNYIYFSTIMNNALFVLCFLVTMILSEIEINGLHCMTLNVIQFGK